MGKQLGGGGGSSACTQRPRVVVYMSRDVGLLLSLRTWCGVVVVVECCFEWFQYVVLVLVLA